MTLFIDIPVFWRQIMMIVLFFCFVAVMALCVIYLKKGKRLLPLVCVLCGVLGYGCLQIMVEFSRMFALNLTRDGITVWLMKLPAYFVISAFCLFVLLSVTVTAPAVKLLKNEWTFPHFSKLKVQLHDTFGLSIVAIKAYYDGQSIDRDTVKVLFSRCRQCFTDKDLFNCRTYESIYAIGKLIGVSPEIHGVLPEDEKTKPIICAALSECMINTFSHAWCDMVYVDITGDEETIISISNNGKAPKSVVVEKGGLKHLRELIESKGGSMSISSLPRFTLTLKLAKVEMK